MAGSVIAREVSPQGAPACTLYRTLQTVPGLSLVSLTLLTGRTHQIRVHLSYLGHPLLGDFLYGTERPELITRPALHSAFLALRHPVTGKYLSFSAPLPEDMAVLAERGLQE